MHRQTHSQAFLTLVLPADRHEQPSPGLIAFPDTVGWRDMSMWSSDMYLASAVC